MRFCSREFPLDTLPDLLKLPGYRMLDFHEESGAYHIRVETMALPNHCPGCRSQDFTGFGKRTQVVRDIASHGKWVGLYVHTRRFRCKTCRRTFYEALPAVHPKRRITARLIAWLEPLTLRQTFAHLAEETGLSRMTIRGVFDDYAARLEKARTIDTPVWLGIDEVYLLRRSRGVLTNLDTGYVLDMLPDRNKPTVIRFLQSLPNPERIRGVAMDMWPPYQQAVRTVLPNAAIVVDKFHVLRLADFALDRVRKDIGQTLPQNQRRALLHDAKAMRQRESTLISTQTLRLSLWFENYPLLKKVYGARQAFYAMYDAPNRRDAEQRWHDWERGMDPELVPAFGRFRKTVRDWAPFIFAYFDQRITNAATESANNLIRIANRLGRGYSFPVIRAKIVFEPHAAQVKRIVFKTRSKQDWARTADLMDRFSTNPGEDGFEIRSQGVDTAGLQRLIEMGEWS
ncbi:MAG: ISL3 family transposase [Gammaproteobacteria bacterium]